MANERTEDRRDRVLDLFAKPDMAIAKKLIEERFFGPAPSGKDDHARFRDTARRTVAKDKDWWREQWRKQKRELSVEDSTMQTEEYVARLKSRLNDVEEVLDDRLVKSTPRVQAIDTAVRIEQAIAKARGSEQAAEKAAEPDAKIPVLGLIIGTKNVSDEWRAKLEKQGVKL